MVLKEKTKTITCPNCNFQYKKEVEVGVTLSLECPTCHYRFKTKYPGAISSMVARFANLPISAKIIAIFVVLICLLVITIHFFTASNRTAEQAGKSQGQAIDYDEYGPSTSNSADYDSESDKRGESDSDDE